jgi:hypothetical protein
MDEIEGKLRWLEDAKWNLSKKSIELFHKRYAECERLIDRLNHFISLKPNQSIQAYWNPIIEKFYDRLIECNQ